jgi:hypothetical protein
LDLLQTVDFPQNRQRNLWKSLEKKGLDLELLAISLEDGREYGSAIPIPSPSARLSANESAQSATTHRGGCSLIAPRPAGEIFRRAKP